MLQKNKALLFYSAVLLLLIQSCTKADIQFGTDLGASYIQVTKVDSILPALSTYVLDSFPTNGPAALLIGRYKDAQLGTISAKPYLQIGMPAAATIAADAVYDSLTLVLRVNKTYYGDTAKSQTIQVKELNEGINYTYASFVYNTSSFAEKPAILGSKSVKIRPNGDDSVEIKLNDVKGLELFTKIKNQDAEVTSQDAFSNYFKGLTISYTNNDSSMIFGVNDTLALRVYYHNTIPYPEPHSIDMTTYTYGIYFNQLLADRSATALAPLLATGLKEIPSSKTNNNAYMQSPLGVYTKISFPTLRTVLQSDTSLKLVAATLVLKASPSTFDLYKYRLPESMFLVTTDGSNAIGNELTGTGTTTAYSAPNIDYLYQTPAYYSFDVTSYINTIATSTTNDFGLFALSGYAGTATGINRAVFNNSPDLTQGTQLILSFLTIKK